MKREDLQAQGDIDLAERLLKEPDIQEAITKFEKVAEEMGARRHLLANALRLAPEMAPDIHETMEACRSQLGLELPVETYVFPAPVFNAAAVRPERGLLFIILSSALLEAFEPEELRFVVGHELGHHLFDHHRIPVGVLLHSGGISPRLVLDLFSWQRYAEISCDRAGMACAGGLDAAVSALFKLASGMRGGRVRVDLGQFLAQVRDLRSEVGRLSKADEPVRADWFSTHPFSPLRVRAAELFAQSELMTKGGLPRSELESQVQELMSLMSASYLSERSPVAESMRRLLFAAAVAIATADGEPSEAALKALEELLGPGSIPRELDPERVLQTLAHREEDVRETVPLLRRAQIIRDLCVIARADGDVSRREMELMLQVADAIEVKRSLVACTLDPSANSRELAATPAPKHPSAKR